MTQITDGTVVKVHYTGTLSDGTQFDSSMDKAPLEFTIGKKEVLAGFEDAVKDLQPGQKTNINLCAEDAYGAVREDMVLAVPAENLPPEIPRNVGEQLIIRSPQGMEIPAIIEEADEKNVVINANHPLAGEELNFEIELVSVG